MKTTTTTTEPTPAEAAAVVSCTRKLARANERLETTLTQIRHRHDDADIAGLRVSLEELEQLYALQAEDQALVERIESNLEAARNAPARRVERDRRARDLQTQAVAIDREIDAAITALESALSKGGVVADAIGREFLDPDLGYRVLIGPFRGSSIISRLRFWRNDISAQRIALYRADRARLERAS